MKLEDFLKNLRNIDEGQDLDQEMLAGIYERIRNQEFRTGSDHVTQVMKVQQTIVAKCPNLALPHRRLVCYCRLYEVNDPNKKERPGKRKIMTEHYPFFYRSFKNFFFHITVQFPAISTPSLFPRSYHNYKRVQVRNCLRLFSIFYCLHSYLNTFLTRKISALIMFLFPAFLF